MQLRSSYLTCLSLSVQVFQMRVRWSSKQEGCEDREGIHAPGTQYSIITWKVFFPASILPWVSGNETKQGQQASCQKWMWKCTSLGRGSLAGLDTHCWLSESPLLSLVAPPILPSCSGWIWSEVDGTMPGSRPLGKFSQCCSEARIPGKTFTKSVS